MELRGNWVRGKSRSEIPLLNFVKVKRGKKAVMQHWERKESWCLQRVAAGNEAVCSLN